MNFLQANDFGVFYGVKYSNELLLEAGPRGHVQSKMIIRKDKNAFTLEQGWVFPHKMNARCLYPDAYPLLPNSPSPITPSLFAAALPLILLVFLSSLCGLRIE
ncbi:hypothetical protein QQP08_011308, partial [Theobroma cacao]